MTALKVIIDLKNRVRNDKNSCDLYIGGGSFNEIKITHSLYKKLDEEGIICSLKYDTSSDYLTQDILCNITNGIDKSKKCVILVTNSYLFENQLHLKYELQEIDKKIKNFSRECVFILKHQDVDDKDIPLSLIGLTNIVVENSFTENMDTIKIILENITKEFNPWLSVLPKDSFGYSLALSYFYGFLKIILPGFKSRFVKEMSPDTDKYTAKLMIVISESCFCPYDISVKGFLRPSGKFVQKRANRAGTIERDYKSTIYEIIDLESKETYYFALELCTPLLTLYEMHLHKLTKLTLEQMKEQRNVFEFIIKRILEHPNNKNCINQYKILLWQNANDNQNDLSDSLYKFILPIIKEEMTITDDNAKLLESDNINHDIDDDNETLLTYKPLDYSDQFKEKMYKDLVPYDLTGTNRGYCIIVNLENYNSSHIKDRTGSDTDEENLTKLFESLHFEVEKHKNLSAKHLHEILFEVSQRDHCSKKAFVCCLLGHGNFDSLTLCDSKQMKFQLIIDCFNETRCPSLRGKPKMFFIQSCLVADNEENARKKLEYYSAVNAPNKFPSYLVPSFPDVLISYSTLPGHKAYRKKGSFYVNALVKSFTKDNGQKKEIDCILKQVSALVQDDLQKKGLSECIPFHVTSGMSKTIFL